jgi:hypothetical protein
MKEGLKGKASHFMLHLKENWRVKEILKYKCIWYTYICANTSQYTERTQLQFKYPSFWYVIIYLSVFKYKSKKEIGIDLHISCGYENTLAISMTLTWKLA